MREIKFRAWEKLREEHGETYGGEMFYSEEADIKRACGFVIETDSGYSNDDFIWMQYTGLKDKNGKEIYEGDILSLSRCNPKEYKVGFIEGAFCLCFIKGIWKNHYALDMNYIQQSLKKKSEVIGNIYQNPELVDNSH